MKIKGIVTGVLRDVNTGEITRTFTETNHIQDWLLSKMSYIYSGSSPTYQFGTRIWVSEMNPGKQRTDLERTRNCVIGENIPGVPSPTNSFYQAGIHLREYQQRFVPPLVDRTIRVIGITTATSVSTQPIQLQTNVYLTSACTQTTTETLDIFYRIQWLYDENFTDITTTADSTQASHEAYYFARFYYDEATFTYPLTVGGTAGGTADSLYNPHQKMNPRRLIGSNSTGEATSSNDFIRGEALSYLLNDFDLYRSGYRFTVDLNDDIGKVVGMLRLGNATVPNSRLMFGRNISEGVPLDPIQNVYGHNSTAVSPFYDSGNLSSGLGTLLFDGSGWTNPDYPKHLRINVTTTGGLGVGEYKIQQRNHFGYELNSYANVQTSIYPFARSNAHYTEGFEVCRSPDTTIDSMMSTMLKYDEQTVAMGYIDEMAIANILSGEGKRFAADTTPALPVVNISQFDVDESTGDVWVACRSTGAYRIDSSQLVVDTFNSGTTGLTGVSGCYGIVNGQGGRVWAFFDGTTPGLYYTDNTGATWTNATFSYPAIDADPTIVTAIHADPGNANHNLAIMYGQIGSAVHGIHVAWWDNAGVVAIGGAAVDGPHILTIRSTVDTVSYYHGRDMHFDAPVTFFNIIDCSPTSGFWAGSGRATSSSFRDKRPARYTFGTVAVDQPAGTKLHTWSSVGFGWGVDNLGNEVLIYTSNNDNIGTTDLSWSIVMFRDDLSLVGELASNSPDSHYGFGTQTPQVYMGNGVFVAVTRFLDTNRPQLVKIFTSAPKDFPDGGAFKDELFPEYGWDGVNWVKGHVGTKAFHATQEPLLDGVTVAFDDASGTTTFNINDYYTVGIVDGVWLDGNTTLEHEIDVYNKPVIAGETDLEAAIIPATTQSPPYLNEFIPDSVDWQDVVGVDGALGIRITNSSTAAETYTSGARSAVPAISGVTMAQGTLTKMDGQDTTGIQGYVEFRLAVQQYIHQVVVGISPTSVAGTAINPNTVAFGIKYDSETYTGGNIYRGNISVIQSGVTVATIPVDWDAFDNDASYPNKNRIILKTDGTVIYEAYTSYNGWYLLYESAPATAPIQDYLFDFALSGQNNYGLKNISYHSPIPVENYLMFGNTVNTGAWTPNFHAVDSKYTTVLIDGVEALNIGDYDDTSVLAAGEYSVFPKSGTLRYSTADQGKSITANYTTIVHE